MGKEEAIEIKEKERMGNEKWKRSRKGKLIEKS